MLLFNVSVPPQVCPPFPRAEWSVLQRHGLRGPGTHAQVRMSVMQMDCKILCAAFTGFPPQLLFDLQVSDMSGSLKIVEMSHQLRY